jgi:hypothetical protein
MFPDLPRQSGYNKRVRAATLAADPTLLVSRPRQTLIADRNYYGKQFKTGLADAGIALLRPARKGQKPPAGQDFSNRSDRSSSRSTTPSRHNWISNATADAPSRRRRPHPATSPCTDCCDLAQRPHRPADLAITNRVRPTEPLELLI